MHVSTLILLYMSYYISTHPYLAPQHAIACLQLLITSSWPYFIYRHAIACLQFPYRVTRALDYNPTSFHLPTCYRMSTFAHYPYVTPWHAIACLPLPIHVAILATVSGYIPQYPYGYTEPHMSIVSYIEHTQLLCNIYSSVHLVLTLSSTQFILYMYSLMLLIFLRQVEFGSDLYALAILHMLCTTYVPTPICWLQYHSTSCFFTFGTPELTFTSCQSGPLHPLYRCHRSNRSSQ